MTQKAKRRSRARARREAARRARTIGPPMLPEWPADKPRPTFSTEAEEVAFLRSFSFAEFWGASKPSR